LGENASPYYLPPVSLAIDRQGDIITVAQDMAGSAPPVYIYKVTDRVGIAEAQERRKVGSFWLPTIIGPARTIQLTIPPGVTAVEVYDQSGRLLQKVGTDRMLRVPSAGVYFIRLESANCQQTGKLVVTR
jgi:hypothetical protein